MNLFIHADPRELGQAAGAEAGDYIAACIRRHGHARIVVATGASQFATIEALVARIDIEWSKVDCFHLDEYVGMTDQHPASFRRYLRERFVGKISDLRAFHGVNGDAADPHAECRRLGELIAAGPIDVLLLGIGENGHLAFNDPPANAASYDPYLVVDLDEACRRQQLGEGWFPTLDAVPRQAISMSIQQILAAKVLVASVPDARKAKAVQMSTEGEIGPMSPGSYLRRHACCSLHLDRASASLLSPTVLQAYAQSGASR